MRYLIFALTSLFLAGLANGQVDRRVQAVWPDMDWSNATVPLDEIMSGGVPRDGIPPVYNPRFETAAASGIPLSEPVVAVEIDGVARAYPLRYMTAHEIVNDQLGGVPVAVTYCPLCNSAIVFDRRQGGETRTFGVSGLLRKSDLIMWDHESESLWQQFQGQAIAGPLAGAELSVFPSRITSLQDFAERHPEGRLLAPPSNDYPYGRNPYVGYDKLNSKPFLYRGDLPRGVAPMQRVVVADETAWSLADIAEAGQIVEGDLRLTVVGEHNSALDSSRISSAEPVASVTVERLGEDGEWHNAVHEVTFAFVFHAFHPNGTWRFGPNASQ